MSTDASPSKGDRLAIEHSMAEKLLPMLDTGDMTVKNLLYFSQPFSEIPLRVLAGTLLVVIWETFIISISTLGSQIIVGLGFVFLNYMERTEGQAALGIAFSFNLIFFYGFFLSLVDKLGIECSQTFGAKQYYKTKVITNQAMWACIIFYFGFTVPCFFFSVEIMTLINIDPAIALKAREILMALLAANLLELMGDFTRACCMAQGFEQVFGTTSLLAVVVSGISGWMLIVVMDLGVLGWVYCKVIYELICVSCACVIFNIIHADTRGFVGLSGVRKGFGAFFFECIKFAVGSYLEFIGTEITSFFVFLTHDNEQIAAYTAILNFASLFYSMGETFSIICRTRMNLLIGKNLKNTAKNFYIFFTFGVILFGSFIGGGVFLTRDLITKLYAGSSERMSHFFYYILTIYCIAIPSELSMTTSFMGVKTIGSIMFLLYMNSLFLIGGNTLYCIVATKVYEKGAIFLFCGLQGINILINMICICKVVLTNWQKTELVIDHELKVDMTAIKDEVVIDSTPRAPLKMHSHALDKEVIALNNLVLY